MYIKRHIYFFVTKHTFICLDQPAAVAVLHGDGAGGDHVGVVRDKPTARDYRHQRVPSL